MNKALFLLVCASMLVALPGCCWWKRHCEEECGEGKMRGKMHHKRDGECGKRRCDDGSCERPHEGGYGRSRHRSEMMEE